MKRACILILVVFSVIACSRSERTAPQAQQPSTQQMPQPGMGDMMAPPAGGAAIAYDLPEGWTRTTPASSMRLDQAQIPGPGGNGELAVFFFGIGGGGGVEENLTRWAEQMESATPPTRESFETGGYKITWMDVAGTLKPSTMGMGPSTPQPDSRMYAGVVEGEGGPWFFKATGPGATMAPQRDGFVAMLKSVRPAGAKV